MAMLNACGFQLRGAYKLPAAMSTTYVKTVPENTAMSRPLIRFLRASNIKIVSTTEDDAATLTLFKEKKSKRIVSVDAKGRAREYTLTYAISFQVATSTGFEMQEQQVSIERDYVFDTEDVLGNSRQEAQLYDEMRMDLLRLILLRLQSRA